jgi:hypothetical protein
MGTGPAGETANASHKSAIGTGASLRSSPRQFFLLTGKIMTFKNLPNMGATSQIELPAAKGEGDA